MSGPYQDPTANELYKILKKVVGKRDALADRVGHLERENDTLRRTMYEGGAALEMSLWCENLRARVEELEAQVEGKAIATCAFCGMEDSTGYQDQEAIRKSLAEHMMVCPDHPMGELRTQIQTARSGIEGALATAAGRWDEWGGRAESVRDILNAALKQIGDAT